jgi:hypothetical protein
MENKYIIDKISSYNNYYDLENKFPSFIDIKIDTSKNKVKDLNKLKKEIFVEKKKHENKCPNKTNCGTSIMYDKSIEIIEIRIQKYSDNNFLKFLSKFWWAFIIPTIIGIIILLFEKMS